MPFSRRASREANAARWGESALSPWRNRPTTTAAAALAASTRQEKDSEGHDAAVMGKANLLQNFTASTQLVSLFRWLANKLGLDVCTSFDQTFRAMISKNRSPIMPPRAPKSDVSALLLTTVLIYCTGYRSELGARKR